MISRDWGMPLLQQSADHHNSMINNERRVCTFANLVNAANVVIMVRLQPNLNWLLRIFRALILCSRVEGGI
jgi:hypothetical protein